MDLKLDFSDVLLIPSFSDIESRSDIQLVHSIELPVSNNLIQSVGIIAANMDGVGTIEVAKELSKYKVLTALHKNYSKDVLVDFFKTSSAAEYTFYSLGLTEQDLTKLHDVMDSGAYINNICLDCPNGYIKKFYDRISYLRSNFPNINLMAGNVVTPDAVVKAYEYGADIIKIGIGSGAQCLTRLQTGVGYPQYSCIIDCVEVADKYGIKICSDGGCSQPGHVAIAYAAGADFVMLGSMLAGTDEGGGEVVDGKVMFYGMSSKTANNKHFGGLKDYRSSEGRTTMIPYKGSMDGVIRNILGGIRSTCTYTGSRTLTELPFRAKAIRVNNTHNRAYEQFTTGN
jgi:GMP reductase